MIPYEGGYLRNPLREGYLKLNFSIEKSDFLVRKCYSTDYNFLSFQYFFMKLVLKERAWPLFFKTSKNIENGSVDKKFHEKISIFHIWNLDFIKCRELKNLTFQLKIRFEVSPPQRVSQITPFINIYLVYRVSRA